MHYFLVTYILTRLGCLQTWSDHPTSPIGLKCPAAGIITRIAWAYRVWNHNAIFGLVPNDILADEERYAEWCNLPHPDAPEYDEGYIHENIWALVVQYWDQLSDPSGPMQEQLDYDAQGP